MINDPVFRIYALCSVILVFQMFFVAMLTGGKRKKHVNVEDTKLFKSELVSIEEDHVARIMRLHRNMIENNLPFFIVGLLFASVGGPLLGAEIGFTLYVVLRFSHMFAYLNGVQPLRTISWATGLATTSVLGLIVLYKVLMAF